MAVQAYLRLCGVEFTSINSHYNGGNLWPALSINHGKIIYGGLVIIDHLKTQGIILDREKKFDLNSTSRSVILYRIYY